MSNNATTEENERAYEAGFDRGYEEALSDIDGKLAELWKERAEKAGENIEKNAKRAFEFYNKLGESLKELM